MKLDGKYVVVTGAIAGESRATAQAKLQAQGAIVQSNVNATTELLITGERVGAKKLAAARTLGVEVMTWPDVWNGIGNAIVAGELPPAVDHVRQVAPQLAKGATEIPSGSGWLFEVKWDGFRGIANVKDGHVSIQSRSGKTDLAGRFPNVAAALSQLPDCVLDGELLNLAAQMQSADDESAFEQLQNGNGDDYVVFDLLELDGMDRRFYTLDQRRELLEDFLERRTSMVVSDFPVHLSPAFANGQDLLDYVDAHGLEGVVAKRRSSHYREGTRTAAWLKIKVRREQEFVVVGWTPGEGQRTGYIGSLVLAVNEGRGKNKRLVYCGRVGSGVGAQTALEFLPPAHNKPAIENPKAAPKDTTWVIPGLVVQVAFQRWTEDGRLWHPSYKGIRPDKRPDQVVRET